MIDFIMEKWFLVLDFLLSDVTLPELLYKMLPAYYIVSGLLFILFSKEWTLIVFGLALIPAAVTIWAARKGVL